MGDWNIFKGDGGSALLGVGTLPGEMTETEVTEVLARLCSRTLSYEEILASSLRRNRRLRTGLLDRIGLGLPIQVGCGEVFFVASREPKAAQARS